MLVHKNCKRFTMCSGRNEVRRRSHPSLILIMILTAVVYIPLHSQQAKDTSTSNGNAKCCRLFPTDLNEGSYCLYGRKEEITGFLKDFSGRDSLDLLLICPSEDSLTIDSSLACYTNLIGLVVHAPKRHISIYVSSLCLPNLQDVIINAYNGSVTIIDDCDCNLNQNVKVNINPLSMNSKTTLYNHKNSTRR
jgi:hypothetical protein